MVAGGMYRPLTKKHSEKKLMTVGVALMIAGLAGLAGLAGIAFQSHDPMIHAGTQKVIFYLAMSVAVVGFAFVNPSVSALVSKNADPARQGEVLGVNQAFASLGRILGPLIGSVLFQAGVSHTLPYLAAVGLLLIVSTLLPRIKTTDSPQRHEGHTETHKESS
jgi:MFS family permease